MRLQLNINLMSFFHSHINSQMLWFSHQWSLWLSSINKTKKPAYLQFYTQFLNSADDYKVQVEFWRKTDSSILLSVHRNTHWLKTQFRIRKEFLSAKNKYTSSINIFYRDLRHFNDYLILGESWKLYQQN